MLRRRDPKFREDLVNMSRAVPVAMQPAATCKQERSAALAIHLFRMIGEIAEGDPAMTIWIRNRQKPCLTINGDITTAVDEGQ